MKHIDIDEMLEFVSFSKLDGHTLELSRRVNGHLRTCDQCRETVCALQAVYDGLSKTESVPDINKTDPSDNGLSV